MPNVFTLQHSPPDTLDSNDLGFICGGVSNAGGYKKKHLIKFEFSITNGITAIKLSTISNLVS